MGAAPPPAAAGKKDPLLKLVAGCVAGSIEATATWPLEYIKTQMQTMRKVPSKGGFVSVPQPYTSMYGGLRYTVRTTGALSLFTGLTPTLLFSAPKAGIRFGDRCVWLPPSITPPFQSAAASRAHPRRVLGAGSFGSY